MIKLHRSLRQRLAAGREAASRKRAAYLGTLPKNKFKRILFRLHPKRLAKYWFSRRGAIMALKITGIGAVAGFLLLVGIFAYFRKDLPNLRDITGNNIGGSIRYYDRTNQTLLWEDYDAVKRIPVNDEEIVQYIKDATIAIEDKDFFKHSGFDIRGIIRAGWNNAFNKGGKQGGSTITQQLVRLTQKDVGKEQTYKRKIKELILSIETERSYSKEEILTGYLNAAPYGGIEYGVEAASRDYFEKSAKDLTLDEATMLAAIPKSPRFYSPYSDDFDRAEFIGRQHYILDLMTQYGTINSQQRDEAKLVDTLAKVKPRKPKYDGIKAPWFVLAAKEQLEQSRNGVLQGGWRVVTTLDLKLQGIAEEEVTKGLAQVRRQGGDSAAFVAEDVKTGQVVALVGGSDFSNPEFGQNNYARLRLPPGSSFKPYDYTSLIEHKDNFGAGSVLYDTQGPLEGYPCTNKVPPKNGGNCLYDFDLHYPGPVTLRYGLGGSRNVPAVKAMLLAGIDKTIDTANALMGGEQASGYKCYSDDALTTEAPCYASSAIGDGAYLKLDEHVHGFASLSRNGREIPRTYILKIEDSKSKVIEEWKPSQGKQAVREDAAFIVSDILSDPKASYFSNKAHSYKGHKFSLKTGTTNDAKDGLLLGYSTQYSAGVWVGYHNRQREMKGFMETMTRPIWSNWMQRAHEDLQPEERARPQSVKTLPAYIVRNHVGAGSIEPSPTNDIYPGWYQQTKKQAGEKRVLDVISNKLATDCTPSRARREVTETSAESFSGDTFVGTGSANTQDKDDIHKCDDAKPSVTLDAPATCNTSCTFVATVVQGTHALSSDQYKGTLNFIIDGQIVQTYNVTSSSSVSFPYTVAVDGAKTVTAEVIDSVLYDASDSATVNFTQAGAAGITIVTPSEGQDVNGGTTTISWTGGAGLFSAFVDEPGGNNDFKDVATCKNTGSNSCILSVATAGNYRIYVKDSAGNQSAVRSFKQ